uniref:Reverse transcriptase domain-containing protein n=1 Tax=Chromera velia CCMP2878 TaxID=1169474 RepID=A0A0G4EZ65_9ALVE|eukprot:Cvel_14246.t1-p1 / transcript=Cvel_14246.t1 / gene=Cvel_14246 / organism=Chromera_velia_CCMP2878 / gene_product=Probable RNA-directed DNA polymerase from, putative / transcript_product=Probable RNA-directed DNA polymerase from, putative / location=Cvel_scaffold1005:31303-40353(+) / protein_length=504 / sequence_SO=supercontig / SO=protein_coding / is_pseudo=false
MTQKSPEESREDPLLGSALWDPCPSSAEHTYFREARVSVVDYIFTHKKYKEAKTAYNRALSAYVKSEAVERERVLQAELQKSPQGIYELLRDLCKRAAARLMPSRADDGTSAAPTTQVPSPWAFAEHFAQVFRCPEESSPEECCSGPLPISSSLTAPGISVSTVSQNARAPPVRGLAPLSTEIPPSLQGSFAPLVPPPGFPPLSPLSDPPPQPEASDPRAPSSAWEATGRVSPFPDLEFFSQEEVKSCLRASKKKKAAGVDGLVVENLRKWSQNPLFVASVTDVFNVCLVEGRIASIWNRCLISPVLKPGKDPEDPASYRAIHLLGHLSKMFSSLIDQRLRKIVSLSRVQFGFQKGKGTRDALFVFNHILKKYHSPDGKKEKSPCRGSGWRPVASVPDAPPSQEEYVETEVSGLHALLPRTFVGASGNGRGEVRETEDPSSYTGRPTDQEDVNMHHPASGEMQLEMQSVGLSDFPPVITPAGGYLQNEEVVPMLLGVLHSTLQT